ncbi:hypothetical protein RB595_004773 [Gaeumannomyces hyphopodioides]
MAATTPDPEPKHTTAPPPSPTAAIILIPGAWHHPVHFAPLATALRSAGYYVSTPALATAGAPDVVRGRTHHADVAAVRAAMDPLLAAGRDVVLAAHSYGGFVAPDAAAGNTADERRALGLRGGVKAIVHLQAIAVAERGTSVIMGLSGGTGRLAPWYEDQDGLGVTKDHCWSIFYSNVDDKVAKDMFAATSRHHSMACFWSECQVGAAEVRARVVYVVSEKDVCMRPEVQHRLADALGPRCEKISLENAGHAPWLEAEALPKVVDILREVADA